MENDNRNNDNLKDELSQNAELGNSIKDAAKLTNEEIIMDLPEVKDIPGQEHIHVPDMREMHDTTISSDDEEGVGLFGDDKASETEDFIEGNESDVSDMEKELLEQSVDSMGSDDDLQLRRAQLDKTDEMGVPLNESTDLTGEDIDTTIVDSDNAMEDIGEEDEENNYYSLPDQD